MQSAGGAASRRTFAISGSWVSAKQKKSEKVDRQLASHKKKTGEASMELNCAPPPPPPPPPPRARAPHGLCCDTLPCRLANAHLSLIRDALC